MHSRAISFFGLDRKRREWSFLMLLITVDSANIGTFPSELYCVCPQCLRDVFR